MYIVNMHLAKSSLSRLVEDIETGRQCEIIIARNGRPVARLVPLDSENAHGPRLGIAKGLFVVPDSIDEMNDEVANLFLGTQQD
jgi:antitoxin (DNA-binding transcriptional repressor) of toxin-antitoxin stability system